MIIVCCINPIFLHVSSLYTFLDTLLYVANVSTFVSLFTLCLHFTNLFIQFQHTTMMRQLIFQQIFFCRIAHIFKNQTTIPCYTELMPNAPLRHQHHDFSLESLMCNDEAYVHPIHVPI